LAFIKAGKCDIDGMNLIPCVHELGDQGVLSSAGSFNVHRLNVPNWVDHQFMRAREQVNNELEQENKMKDDWPFDQPRNAACISLRQIFQTGAPILHVTHDTEDHGWQFLGLEDAKEEDAWVVSLEEVVKRDPSVLRLAYMLPGWHAWRKTEEDEWKIEKQ